MVINTDKYFPYIP